MRAALYLRVSTKDQELEHQERELRAELERRGWELAGVYAEKVSGVAARRPELERMMHDAALSRFKVVVVWAMDRLGRSLLEVLGILQELERRGVAFVSLQQPMLNTDSPAGRMIVQVIGACAEFERGMLSERTKAGLRTARARGKRIGRPRTPVTPDQVANLLRLNNGSTALTARQLGVSLSTVKRLKTGVPKTALIPASKTGS